MGIGGRYGYANAQMLGYPAANRHQRHGIMAGKLRRIADRAVGRVLVVIMQIIRVGKEQQIEPSPFQGARDVLPILRPGNTRGLAFCGDGCVGL